MSFSSLGLIPELLQAIRYERPTPIQLQAIPAILRGGDILAGAQTGTGKTAGFTLPMLQLLNESKKHAHHQSHPPIRGLVLTPTRELAAQVHESVCTYGKNLDISSTVIFGGVGAKPQIDALRRGVDVLVATPGRLLDLYQQGHMRLNLVQIFVLDEADRMLDMGFIHDIKKVLAVLPQKKQSLLFSATYTDEIKELADRLLNKPALIEVARRNATADTISQKVYHVGRDKKADLLAHLIKTGNWHRVLVFTRTKHGANHLVEKLHKQDITAMAIHGNKSQTARTKALADFKSGELQALVATDIAARGIDIDQLPHVVNYELSNVPEDYVHRIGRTGRAGAEGEAISLVCRDEEPFLRDIERLIKHSIPQETVAGFEAPDDEVAEPIVLGRRMIIGVKDSDKAMQKARQQRKALAQAQAQQKATKMPLPTPPQAVPVVTAARPQSASVFPPPPPTAQDATATGKQSSKRGEKRQRGGRTNDSERSDATRRVVVLSPPLAQPVRPPSPPRAPASAPQPAASEQQTQQAETQKPRPRNRGRRGGGRGSGRGDGAGGSGRGGRGQGAGHP